MTPPGAGPGVCAGCAQHSPCPDHLKPHAKPSCGFSAMKTALQKRTVQNRFGIILESKDQRGHDISAPSAPGRGPVPGSLRPQMLGTPCTRVPEAAGGAFPVMPGPQQGHEAGTRALPPFVHRQTRHRGNKPQSPLSRVPKQVSICAKTARRPRTMCVSPEGLGGVGRSRVARVAREAAQRGDL